jgi:hypothetical protein
MEIFALLHEAPCTHAVKIATDHALTLFICHVLGLATENVTNERTG